MVYFRKLHIFGGIRMKKCPECGLENEDKEISCDCGYSFLNDFTVQERQDIFLEGIYNNSYKSLKILKFFYGISIFGLICLGIYLCVFVLSWSMSN